MVRTMRNVPGQRALAFVSRWFEPDVVSTVFEPLIADWQRQWDESGPSQRPLVWIGGTSALVTSALVATPRALAVPWPDGTRLRILRRVTFWTLALSTLLSIPFMIEFGRHFDIRVSAYLLLLILPSSAALALPVAFATIVDLLRTSQQPTHQARVAMLKCAIASLAVMLVLVGWVFPASNQQYRVSSNRAFTGRLNSPGPARGLRELSIVELLQDDTNCRQWLGKGDPVFDQWCQTRVDPKAGELSKRLALSLLPIAMMWMRWRALRLPRGHWYSPFPAMLSAPLLFASCMFLWSVAYTVVDGVALAAAYGQSWTGPWLATAVLAIASIGIDRLRRRAAGLA